MKPLFIISLIGYIGWLFQYDNAKNAEQEHKRTLIMLKEAGNQFARENFILGLKSGYILKTKNGSKEDIDRVIAEWPRLNYITQFTAK